MVMVDLLLLTPDCMKQASMHKIPSPFADFSHSITEGRSVGSPEQGEWWLKTQNTFEGGHACGGFHK